MCILSHYILIVGECVLLNQRQKPRVLRVPFVRFYVCVFVDLPNGAAYNCRTPSCAFLSRIFDFVEDIYASSTKRFGVGRCCECVSSVCTFTRSLFTPTREGHTFVLRTFVVYRVVVDMAGESLNCTAARKSTSRHNNNNRTASSNSLSSDMGGRPKGAIPMPVTTRGGLRVYKVVILGDGGVGKSGEWR